MYRKSNNNIQLLQLLRFLQEKLNSFISVSKQNATRECQLNLLNFIKFESILVLVKNIFK